MFHTVPAHSRCSTSVHKQIAESGTQTDFSGQEPPAPSPGSQKPIYPTLVSATGKKVPWKPPSSLSCSGMLAGLVLPKPGVLLCRLYLMTGQTCPGCVTHAGSTVVGQGMWLEICHQQIIIKKSFGVEAVHYEIFLC